MARAIAWILRNLKPRTSTKTHGVRPQIHTLRADSPANTWHMHFEVLAAESIRALAEALRDNRSLITKPDVTVAQCIHMDHLDRPRLVDYLDDQA